MDVLLQNHNAKHVCDIPDGLRELCADISREVIRSQPHDLCCFIAGYLDTLLITRENAKVAIKIVQNVMLRSEHIVEILSGTGLKLEEMAATAPRLQKAFRVYLDAVDKQKKECGCSDDSDMDDEYEISICKILRDTGASFAEAQRAAIRIQALFRGHYERLSLAEKRGEVQWQRAAVNTMELLRKTGITEIEASFAATTIQAAYRGYYTRKNLKRRRDEENAKIDIRVWLKLMFENTGLTFERANEAATIIQKAYRKYRPKLQPDDQLLSSSQISEREKCDSVREATSKSTQNVEESIEHKESTDDVIEIKPDETPLIIDLDEESSMSESIKEEPNESPTEDEKSTQNAESIKEELVEITTKEDEKMSSSENIASNVNEENNIENVAEDEGQDEHENQDEN